MNFLHYLAMASFEKEQERLQKLLEEILSDEDGETQYDDQSDDDVSDREELEIHETDSEQEISDVGEDDIYVPLLCKDNITYWKKHLPVTKAVKTRSENLIKRLPGSSMVTRLLKKPIEIWNYFFNEEILNIIVHSTNKYIQSVSDNYARPRDAKSTDIVEICALFGLLHMARVSHVNRQNRDDIWKINGYRFTVIGTIRKNKRELPVEFSKPVSRPEKSSMFRFRNECTPVSYIPKKGKNVLLVSSLPHSDNINNETGDLQKPEMVTEYNKTTGVVDVVDKLVSIYDCAGNTRRRPMVIFYTTLNADVVTVDGKRTEKQDFLVSSVIPAFAWNI
ncbi:hypothetical protein NQ314_000001 [Rhamnusium bicolor]|uniref:PiggyBac transposable element-derived protein domain-containing protein n=1 Tax=Rhamnusium bicolor TaxID=1586634 RepID=A0AAV8ZXE4_9CUCU|nr:hypothetical protein NQ314_000001 [Rhamnusium bicolor]